MPLIGFKHSAESKEKMRLAHLGKKFTEEHKRNMGLSGINNPMFGKYHSKKTRLKMSESRKGKICQNETRNKIRKSQLGEKNHAWNG
jgi:hypothetical protein